MFLHCYCGRWWTTPPPKTPLTCHSITALCYSSTYFTDYHCTERLGLYCLYTALRATATGLTPAHTPATPFHCTYLLWSELAPCTATLLPFLPSSCTLDLPCLHLNYAGRFILVDVTYAFDYLTYAPLSMRFVHCSTRYRTHTVYRLLLLPLHCRFIPVHHVYWNAACRLAFGTYLRIHLYSMGRRAPLDCNALLPTALRVITDVAGSLRYATFTCLRWFAFYTFDVRIALRFPCHTTLGSYSTPAFCALHAYPMPAPTGYYTW